MQKRLLADELFAYLLELSSKLKNYENQILAEAVLFTSRFASGSTTELYAESRSILNRVLNETGTLLTNKELRELKNKISQIDSEFDRVGGA